MKKVICLSGGLDSTVLAYDLNREAGDLLSLSFHYGQTHQKETIAASRIAIGLGIPNKLVDFSSVVGRGDNALTGGEGSPVVPNRNATMLSIAVTYAEGIGADAVYYCPTREDFDLFPDCRPAFVSAFNKMLKASGGNARVFAPYIAKRKSDIVKIGADLGVPFDQTWSCYAGGSKPCGSCLACKSRSEAMACIR
jgi:7-cyano-7-deazaguanine synthase